MAAYMSLRIGLFWAFRSSSGICRCSWLLMRTPDIHGGTAPDRLLEGDRIPDTRGTYAVILWLPGDTEVEVGRLGRHQFPSGWYVYIGSAFGPGGLRARIQHHLRPARRPHWHLDFLKQHATISAVWHCSEDVGREHSWAEAMSRMRGASLPVTNFGSSDCRCRTHLFRFVRVPRARSLLRRLRRTDTNHPSIKVLQLLAGR